jgi:hypothetical protein
MNITQINKKNQIKYGWMNNRNIKTDPQFLIRKFNEEKLRKDIKFKNKTPIDCLKINGYDVLCDERNGNVIVCIDISTNIFEGVDTPRLENLPDSNYFSIPKEHIVDYNSLWEITKTGWDSGTPRLYPYIFIKHNSEKKYKMWRWDNSNFLRVLCLTHNWSKNNYEKFYNSNEFKKLFNNQPESFNKKNKFIELGRNQKCWCGSGKKYKICCQNEPQKNQFNCDVVVQG